MCAMNKPTLFSQIEYILITVYLKKNHYAYFKQLQKTC